MKGKLYALYFSATGNTKKITMHAANALAEQLGRDVIEIDVTCPSARDKKYCFTKEDVLVVGAPTYAGKLPNKILPFFADNLKGDKTPCVPLVTFGNRDFENSLAELCYVMVENGFRTVGGAAIVGEHPFSKQLGTMRPTEEDLQEAEAWIEKLQEKMAQQDMCENTNPENVFVPGDAAAPYYVPKQVNGEPAVFLKAKPKTDMEKCTGCRACVDVCPMGSVSAVDPSVIEGICIKCHGCIKGCPSGAKYMDDAMFLSHVRMLEENYREGKKNLYFL